MKGLSPKHWTFREFHLPFYSFFASSQFLSFFFFFIIFIYLFIFWLCWVFFVVGGFSLVVMSRAYSLVSMHRLLIEVASFVVEHEL